MVTPDLLSDSFYKNSKKYYASYRSFESLFNEIPTLSLYAEYDGLTTEEKINDTKHLLSSETTLYEVKGGNHAQFGMYGAQKVMVMQLFPLKNSKIKSFKKLCSGLIISSNKV